MLEASKRLSFERETFQELFQAALDAQARAEERSASPVRRAFKIGCVDAQFRLASAGLGAIFCNALAHIEVACKGESDFTFHIWDEASSGVGLPRALNNATALIGSDHYLEVAHDGAMVAAAYRPSRRAIVWVRSVDQIPKWETRAPLQNFMHWWATGFGYFTVHAASVGRPEGGALVVGRPGAGKSHTAISCLDSDLLYVADDQCLLSAHGRPASASIYSTAGLFRYDLHRFPMLARRQKDGLLTEEGKVIFFLNTIAPDHLSRGFPVKAILIPNASGRPETRVEPVSPSAALLLLGPYSVFRWPGAGGALLAHFASILKSLPCFRLDAGTDMSQIPKAITSVLDML